MDFTPAAIDYAARPPFPARLYARLAALGIGTPGQRLLDLGGGNGLLCIPLAGPCRVTLADLSPAMLGLAPLGLPRVVARAESLPFADACFDCILAGQCWHWFNRDLAPPEVMRVLRPGGSVAVVYQMPVPLAGSVAGASEKAILRFVPQWRHANSAGINGQVLRDLQAHGFEQIESFSFDVNHRFTRRQWAACVRSGSAVSPSMDSPTLAAFDAALAGELASWGEAFDVPHRVFAAIARKAGNCASGRV